MKIPFLKTDAIKQNQWIALIALLLIYKIYFVYFFYVLPIGFTKSILEKLHLDNFIFSKIYEQDSFVLAACGYLYFIVPVVLLSAFLCFFSKKTSWENIDQDLLKPTKYFILFVALFTTWFFAFSSYNYYFDKPYYFDRFFIVLLFVLLFRYTWLLPVFLGTTFLWLAQFNFPLGAQSMTDKKIIYEILLLFLAYLTIKPVFKVKTYLFWIVLFSLIASNYFIPAIEKMRIGPTWYSWMSENELWVHLRSAFSRHWMSFLDSEQKDKLYRIAEKTNFLMIIYTIIVEVFAIFILYKRKFAITLLILFSILHIGIFIESGIFFWKWILFNLSLATILIVYKESFVQLFTTKNFYISVCIIILSPWVFQPVKLAWWDVPFYEVIQYEVTDKKNQKFVMAGNQMRPYEQYFTFGRMNFLIPDSVPVVGLSTTDYNKFCELKKMDFENINDWVDKNKMHTYDSVLLRTFDNFVLTFFKNYNKHFVSNDIYVPRFATPDHIWTGKYPLNKFPEKSEIKYFKVKFLQYYQTGTQNYLLNEKYIYEKEVACSSIENK